VLSGTLNPTILYHATNVIEIDHKNEDILKDALLLGGGICHITARFGVQAEAIIINAD